jgi:hypothetical protein
LRASLSGTAWRTNGGNGEEEVEQNINLEKIQNNASVSVYPNPSTGAFSVDILNLSAATTSDIKVIDVTGKIVYAKEVPVSQGINTKEINLQNASGLYQVIVRTGDEVSVEKIMIQQ